jgi:acetyl-CoA carboxylase alpha subunit
MVLIDEVNAANVLQIQSGELIMALHSIKRNKESEIMAIKNKIKKYEEKRRQEEAMYRTLSPIKKLFTSRTPSHHQAVEYMVNVKERLKTISAIKQSIAQLDKLIADVLSEQSTEEMYLSRILLEEIQVWKEAEVYGG